jgi:hypothetical protein
MREPGEHCGDQQRPQSPRVLERGSDLVLDRDVDADLLLLLVALSTRARRRSCRAGSCTTLRANCAFAMASAMIDPRLDTSLPTSARDRFCLISTLRKLVIVPGVRPHSL